MKNSKLIEKNRIDIRKIVRIVGVKSKRRRSEKSIILSERKAESRRERKSECEVVVGAEIFFPYM